MNEDRFSRVQRARLRGLLDERGVAEAEMIESATLPVAVAGDECWMALPDDEHATRHGVGAALSIAISPLVRGRLGEDAPAALHLITGSTEQARVLARRAEPFAVPISVWVADGRTMRRSEAAPLPEERPPLAAHLAFTPVIAAAGATPVVEHGVVSGEVRGLEVCRVVDDPHSGAARLEVGVGAHDREVFQMLHGDVPTEAALAGIVARVAEHRQPGAAPHPLGALAAERALRQRVVDDPSLIGASVVAAIPPSVARRNVKDPAPCHALATIDGDLVTVTFAVGVELEAVPLAAEARAAQRTVAGRIVVPARDALRLQQRLSNLLVVPIAVVGLPAIVGQR